ncbi:zwei Ig domain protein zig-8-like [Macrosteles quadrilineatus]|uniref:zwei Ig domain protein zig-8-like n=1 Tax=Macrosteles quadrilineatus TaxID=74068 RepID=UPI0023E19D44|nr:zwei Ig domain protein zig-8-like [Macrosteles quadrilineatus]
MKLAVLVILLLVTTEIAGKHHHRLKVDDNDWWLNAIQPYSPSSADDGLLVSPTPGPEHVVFLSENCTKVTAQTGSTSVLHCEVGGVTESMVSWIRRTDYQLLTVGLATYSSDDRFFTAHVHNEQDWALHIKFAQMTDEGLYECQVSTHPPISIFVTLKLVESKAEIVGGSEKMVQTGSSLRLICLLRHSMEPPSYIFWYHDSRMINYDTARGVEVTHERFSSELVLPRARSDDSGNYTCVPSNAQAASISVHVIKREKPAAMQHERTSSSNQTRGLSEAVILCIALLSSIS